MDKSLEEIWKEFVDGSYVPDEDIIDYLFARLKKAESERDERYTKSATSVIREEQERHAAEMLEVLEALNGNDAFKQFQVIAKYRRYLEEK
jgi:hypothetical protein